MFDGSQDALQPGYGKVAITLNGVSARTVFPIMTFAKYEYLFTKVIDGNPEETQAQSPANGYFTLQFGNWQVTVNAYINNEDTTPAITGTSDVFTVSGGTIEHIVIQMGNATAGAGGFSYHIVYPNGSQISIFTLENLLNGNVISIGGNGQAGEGVLVLSGTRANIPAGYYYLTIELKEDGVESRITGANEVVYIYDNLDSEYSISFTTDDFSHIHLWGEWIETNAPTETTDGLETRLCANDWSGIHTRTSTLYATGTPGLSFVTIGYPAAAYRVSGGSVSGTVHIPAMYRPNAYSPYLPVTEINSYAFQSSDITSITIPASVTSISSQAFYNCYNLTSITVDGNNPNYASEDGILYNKAKTQLIIVPRGISGTVSILEGVTSIGNSMFSDCSNLTGITIPASVTSIGNSAFYNCSSLTGITIPTGITSIGNNAFSNCNSLTSITIPAGVTSIGEWAFSSCNNLTNITILAGVTSIGNYTFYNCSSLTSITIPAGVTSIGNSAFSSCSSLASITLPASVTSIGDSAFYYCYNLTDIAIPTGVTSIGSEAFYYCYNLASITLPASVTTIGYSAFNSCWGLTAITIPAGVTSIGNYAFSGCSSLTGITVNGGNQHYASEGGILYNRTKTQLITVPQGMSGDINIPAGVTVIGESAFNNCYNLTGVTLPASVTEIGSNAFFNCSSLTSIKIPERVTSIGYSAFYNCSSLTSIEISASVTSIGDYAFDYCNNLSSIIVDGRNQYYASEGAILYNKTRTRVIAVAPAGIIGNISVSTSITSIGDRAFYNCTGLTGITIPASVTEIGYYAFYNTGLTSINIPASVTSISDYTFTGCNSLTSITVNGNNQYYASEDGVLYNKAKTQIITVPEAISGNISIPAGVTSIDSSAFYNRNNLTGVTLPSSVTSIGGEAFRNCTGLTSISIPSSVTSIGHNAFNYCTSLTSITIPDSVKSIGEGAFYYCTSLTSITIPEGVTSIDSYAFSNCTSLTSVTIPASVTSIGNQAFYNWTNTQTINILGHASQAAADAAWGSSWRSYCYAIINYLGIGIDSITAQFWRANAAVSLTAPQVSAGGGTVTAQGWQISDNGSSGWSNFTPPSTAAMSHNGRYLRYYAVANGSTYYSNTVTILVISGSTLEVTVEMWDNYGDGWDGTGALRIVVNTTVINSNVKPYGSYDSYTFSVNSGDEVNFYWVEGSAQSENAFAVYYTNYPPSLAFSPYNGAAVDSSRILLYRQYGTMDSTSNGALLGSFKMP